MILAQHNGKPTGRRRPKLPGISQRWQPLAKVQVHQSSHLALCLFPPKKKKQGGVLLRSVAVWGFGLWLFSSFLGFWKNLAGSRYPTFHYDQAMIPDLPFLFIRYLAEKIWNLNLSTVSVSAKFGLHPSTSCTFWFQCGMCCRWQQEAWINPVEHMVFDGWPQWSHA